MSMTVSANVSCRMGSLATSYSSQVTSQMTRMGPILIRPTIDEHYAAKAMPDLGLEIEDFQAQTWKIENWSQQPKRLQGPEFSCGGHKW